VRFEDAIRKKMVTLFVGRACTNAVINQNTNITEHKDLLLFSTTGGHTTLSMVQLNKNGVPPDVTQYDRCYSANEMDLKLHNALIFLLDAFRLDKPHHTKIKADVPSQIGEKNCGPLACIPFIEQLTQENNLIKRAGICGLTFYESGFPRKSFDSRSVLPILWKQQGNEYA
jgi:hypothetical protein